MEKKRRIPIISNDLIKYLDAIFPNKCADLQDTEKKVFYKSGQRSVVNHLIKEKKIQEEN